MYLFEFVPNFDSASHTMFSKTFKTLKEAKAAHDAVAEYTLLLHGADMMKDYSNYGCVFERVNDEWEEIEI